MDSVELYVRKQQLLTNTKASIEELRQKRQLLLDEIHRVDAQLTTHNAYMLKLQVELDET